MFHALVFWAEPLRVFGKRLDTTQKTAGRVFPQQCRRGRVQKFAKSIENELPADGMPEQLKCRQDLEARNSLLRGTEISGNSRRKISLETFLVDIRPMERTEDFFLLKVRGTPATRNRSLFLGRLGRG